MLYDISILAKEQTGWSTSENRRIDQDIQVGDFIFLSHDEATALKCDYVYVVGRVISTNHKIKLFCRPSEDPYDELMNKIFAL